MSKKWSEKEDLALILAMRTKKSWKEIQSTFPGRSITSIRKKVERLNRKKETKVENWDLFCKEVLYSTNLDPVSIFNLEMFEDLE